MRNLLFALALLVTLSSAFATTYYVNNSIGKDSYNGRFRITPFKTINRGVSFLTPGDVLIIIGGIEYSEKVIFNNAKKFTSQAPILIQGEGNVIIKGTPDVIKTNIDGTKTYSGVFVVHDRSNIYIKNINIKESIYFGFYILKSLGGIVQNITIENCSTFNTVASGIRVEGGTKINIKNNIIDKACNFLDTTYSIHECISLSKVDTFEISNNEVKNGVKSLMGGEGIDAKSGCKNGNIINNYVHDLLNDHGIYVDAYENKNSENIVVSGNTVTNCTQGIVLSCEKSGTLSNIEISNNLVYKNKGDGIIISNYGDKTLRIKKFNQINIINNTCYKNGGVGNNWGHGIIIMDSIILERINIMNNICSDNFLGGIRNSNTYMKDKILLKRNLSYPEKKGAKIIFGADSIIKDPLFYNVTTLNFSLKQNSPAINAGEAVTSPKKDFLGIDRKIGVGVDLGAFERINSFSPTISQKGLLFNGSNVDSIPNNSKMSFPTVDCTFEFMMKVDQFAVPLNPPVPEMILANTNSNAGYCFFYLNRGLTGQPDALHFRTGRATVDFSKNLKDGKCHHYAFVSTSLTTSIYMDGILMDQQSNDNFAAIGNTTQPWYIGNVYSTEDVPLNGFYQGLKGSVKELRVWNRAKSKTEIEANMNYALNGYELNLVGYWPMNEGAGQIINDNVKNDKIVKVNGYLGNTSSVDAFDPNWNSNSCTTVNARVENETSSELVIETEQISLSPNPFNNEIQLNLINDELVDIEIINVLGTIIHHIKGARNFYKFGADLNSGYYLVKINNNQEQKVFKVIKE